MHGTVLLPLPKPAHGLDMAVSKTEQFGLDATSGSWSFQKGRDATIMIAVEAGYLRDM
jgi:hypothetical protein